MNMCSVYNHMNHFYGFMWNTTDFSFYMRYLQIRYKNWNDRIPQTKVYQFFSMNFTSLNIPLTNQVNVGIISLSNGYCVDTAASVIAAPKAILPNFQISLLIRPEVYSYVHLICVGTVVKFNGIRSFYLHFKFIWNEFNCFVLRKFVDKFQTRKFEGPIHDLSMPSAFKPSHNISTEWSKPHPWKERVLFNILTLLG